MTTSFVTCRDCLATSPLSLGAVNRIAELDRVAAWGALTSTKETAFVRVSVVHWGTHERIVCGNTGQLRDIGCLHDTDCNHVTCRVCLSRFESDKARDRLAELDRLQDEQDEKIASALEKVVDTGDLMKAIHNASPGVNAIIHQDDMDHINGVLGERKKLLLRVSDFIADLPSGSLDRKRNVEAMAIRRAIADAVVPADKPKLSTGNVKIAK